MVLGIGTDIIEIDRIKRVIEQSSFLEKYFTEEEREFFIKKKNNPQHVAGSFASKEAVAKSLGTGFRNFGLKDIEILRDVLGCPYVNLYGEAKEVALRMGISRIHISISHCYDYATAFAVAEGGKK